jgi:hypothetical protein
MVYLGFQLILNSGEDGAAAGEHLAMEAGSLEDGIR